MTDGRAGSSGKMREAVRADDMEKGLATAPRPRRLAASDLAAHEAGRSMWEDRRAAMMIINLYDGELGEDDVESPRRGIRQAAPKGGTSCFIVVGSRAD